MDDNKGMSNEEMQATPEQPAEILGGSEVAPEVAEEPAQQEVEPAGAEEPAPATETPTDESPAAEQETPVPGSCELPTTAERSSQEIEITEQTDETLVEMLDAVTPQETEQETAESEPPVEAAEAPAVPADDASPTVESVIEAVLFATDEPLPEVKLAGIVEATAKQVRGCIDSLNARYEANRNAFRIEQIAGGYQMLTQPVYNSWLKKMVKARSDNKLSPAAMETLAIIAYKQPIIRADIEAIRGVAVGEVIRSLMYKGLVKIAGRAEILGRPMLYGTTKKFLEIFGLNSVKDLPKAEDLKNPDRG